MCCTLTGTCKLCAVKSFFFFLFQFTDIVYLWQHSSPQGHRWILSINHISLDTCTCTCSCFVWRWRPHTTCVRVKWNCTGTPFWIYPWCYWSVLDGRGPALESNAIIQFLCTSDGAEEWTHWPSGSVEERNKADFQETCVLMGHHFLPSALMDWYLHIRLTVLTLKVSLEWPTKPGCRQSHIVISNKQKKGTWPAQLGFFRPCEVIYMTVIVKEHRYLQSVQMCSKETMVVLASAPHPISVHDSRSL